MANEIMTVYTTGKALDFSVYYDNAGTITAREADQAMTEQPAGSGVYKGTPAAISAGDIIVIEEGAEILSSEIYWPEVTVSAMDDIDLTATQKTSVNTEVDNALNTAIPGSPTADSINERVAAIDAKLPSKTYLMGSADADGGFDTEAKADVNTEADSALDTAVPGSPTANSINERVKAIDDLTQASGAGDLAAILTDTGTTLENRAIAIEADTDDIQTQVGTAGAGLSDLGGMSTGMKAEVNVECDGAFATFDPPTRTEATADKAAIITEVDANETKIDTLTTNVAAIDTGLVAASSTAKTGTLTTTVFTTNLTEASDDHYNNMVILFTGGNLAGQARRIRDYTGATKTVTVSPALTEAPANTNAFVILGSFYSMMPSSGALEITYTVKEDDEDTGDPIDGVEVWIKLEDQTDTLWAGTTDANGIAKDDGDSKPYLDAGTYDFYRRKSGYAFTNPDTETFS